MPQIYTLNYTGTEINELLSKIRRSNVVLSDTTANWNAQRQLISEAGTVYVYTDYHRLEDDVGNVTFIPDFKVGDGLGYLIDAPFVSAYYIELLREHTDNSEIHVSSTDRAFWNNKVAAVISTVSNEKLILYNSQLPPSV